MSRQKPRDPLVPEVLRLVKIFGAASVLLILAMAFFNERKANNSGENDSPMHMGDAERLFFKNVRGINYDFDRLSQAKMERYRYSTDTYNSTKSCLHLAILINTTKDEAYLYWELRPDSLPVTLHFHNLATGAKSRSVFSGGDKFAHLAFGKELFPYLKDENTRFEVEIGGIKRPLFADLSERNGVRITLEDYFRLIDLTPSISGN